MVVRKGEEVGTKYFNDSKGIIEYLNDMDQKNFEKYNPKKKKSKILIVFNDMIADMFKSIKRIQ